MERRDYLELMTGQIRCKKMCPVITKEVEDHIEDQKQAFMAEGMKEEEAEKAAVEEMGDPVEVGVEMDQIHRPKMPWKVIFVIALMQILSGMFAAFFLKQNESYGYIAGIRQIFRLAMAFSVMILVCYMDYSWIGKHARLLAGSYLLFMVLMRHFFALQINGAVRWIGVGDFIVSLSLMSWLFLPLYGAVLYRYRGEGYGAVLKTIVWMLLICRDPDHLSGSCDGRDGWTFLCLYADAGTGKGMVSGCGYKGDDRNKYQCCWSSGWHTGIFFLLWCGISEKPYPGDVCSE